MRKLLLIACLFAGCARSPKYCDDCRAIKELQAKTGKLTPDYERLDDLKKRYAERAVADLHADCDCPCHLHVR
jgi:hypothetical protein